jgi:hypothetical protein
MAISDEKLSKIYKEFKKSETEDFLTERKTKIDFFQKKFSLSNISKLEEGDIRETVRRLWAFQMWTNKDYLANEILKDGLEFLRNNIKKALYESKNKGEAFDYLIENIRMMGPASASEILNSIFPEECGIWNEKARDGLKILFYSDVLPLDKKNIKGKEYEKFNNILSELRKNLRKMDQDVEDFMELDYFLYYLFEKGFIEEKKEEKIKDFNHNEMIDTLLEIGDGLGFDVDKEYMAGPGARIDVRWSTKVANLGRIAYAFEVQRGGSPDSAILNLQKARNADPSLQKLVIVSTEEQLEKFRMEIGALDENFRKFVSYLTVDKVTEASENLKNLKEILQETGLMEEIGVKI